MKIETKSGLWNKYFKRKNIKKPLLNKSQGELYSTELDEKLKNKQRENKIKEIFSSHGVVFITMNDTTVNSPMKLRSKITSKEYNITKLETKLTKQDTRKFRKNSCHNFHNKSGFYME